MHNFYSVCLRALNFGRGRSIVQVLAALLKTKEQHYVFDFFGSTVFGADPVRFTEFPEVVVPVPMKAASRSITLAFAALPLIDLLDALRRECNSLKCNLSENKESFVNVLPKHTRWCCLQCGLRLFAGQAACLAAVADCGA
jgi:hypothetical protein